ncbi:MAG TPA: hypothetical protein VD997_06200 [Phycisphaerales bacterium]|nr:hypothetical protein [Phycisphaerales bacterium]
MHRVIMSLIVTVALAAAPAALAQSPAPQETRPGNPAPLSGPKVTDKTTRPTIAARDLDGKVRRPETSPEEAAAKLLSLDKDARAKVDAVFAKRARTLEKFIEENLDLMSRLITAESATGREKFALFAETLEKSKALREDGPLDQQVRAALPEKDRKHFDRLLREYWDAIAAEDKQTPRDMGKPKGRVGAVIDEKFKSLGREIEAAYRRCERSGTLLYHYLFDSIEVTPEQEKQLRKLCSSYAVGGIDNKDKKAQGVMLANLMQILTKEQGQQLAAKFKGGGAPKYEKRKKADKPEKAEDPASMP